MTAMWAVENSCEQDGLHVDIMSLNANNAAVIRRFVKWAAPGACGTKGTVSVSVTGWELQADALRRCLLKSR